MKNIAVLASERSGDRKRVAETLRAIGSAMNLPSENQSRRGIWRAVPGLIAAMLLMALVVYVSPSMATEVSRTATAIAAKAGGLPGPAGAAIPMAAPNKPTFKIVTGPERGTDIQIGHDLARFVAADADINLLVLPSKGSTENIYRLRDEPGVKLGIVQYDVFQAFLSQAANGNAKAGRVIRPLRVITPLYTEEVYFITRSDSPLTYIHEIRGKKINLGPLGSGSALSVATVYQRMFGTPIPDANASFLSDEEALVKLTFDKTIDVVVVIGGQPAKLLADMKPAARQFIKLLKLDRKDASSRKALKSYFPATIWSSSYSNWLQKDVPTLSVMTFLVTADYTDQDTNRHLSKFARALCRNFPLLQAQGHPKWREVQLGLQLGEGWRYSSLTEPEFNDCRSAGNTG